MRHVDPQFPVFVLLGLLVGESYYAKTLVPRIKRLKQKHFSSSDIRKRQGVFASLRDETQRLSFYDDLNKLYAGARIRLYAVVIDKLRLRDRYLTPVNPYDVSLSQLLSVVCGPPRIVSVNRPIVRKIVAESRGRVEDKQLQEEYQGFRRSGLASYGADRVQTRRPATVQRLFPERIDFAKKSMGIGGLELADLAAYPIAQLSIETGIISHFRRSCRGCERSFSSHKKTLVAKLPRPDRRTRPLKKLINKDQLLLPPLKVYRQK